MSTISLTDIADGIWGNELNETTETNIPKIMKWLSFHLGELNDMIATDYIINGNDAAPQLTSDEASIYVALYLDSYYSRMIKENLGAAGIQVLEVRENDSVVRVASKTEISKVYLQLKNQNKDHLNKLVDSYRRWQCIPASLHLSCHTYQKTLEQP